MTEHKFFPLFRQAVSRSFSTLQLEELKDIALAVWYENLTPDISDLNPTQQQKAGYLLDRLMRYNCVSKSRKLELLQLVNTLKINLNCLLDFPDSHAEPLAQAWGLKEDISNFMPHLLEYQTRHYTHS
jgi:hypothetical protein